MITREFPPQAGGIGSYVYSLSKQLVQKGHRATVITRGSSRRLRKRVADDIDVFEAPFFPIYPFHLQVHGRFVESVLESIRPRPALVHVHTPIVPIIKTSIPMMITVHTPSKIDARYQEMYNVYYIAAKAQSMLIYPPIERELMKRSKKITTVAHSVAEELAEYGVKPSEVTVVGNGVDEKVFVPSVTKKGEEKYVSCTGGLRGRKGLFDLLECAVYVSKNVPDIQFVITGKGPLLNVLRKKAKKLGIENNVCFPGFVTRKRLIQIYQNATLHVVPSVYEGLPTVLLEAMSCGLPVVATAVGGALEVVDSGKNGLLVPAKAPEEMAKAILKLIAEPRLREVFGTKARETIKKRYTWSTITDNILKSYKTVISS